jgi:hypothetical protein
VLAHKLLQHILFLLLLAGRLALPLHLLVEHHLLDHAARLAVEVAELGVLRLDLGDVDGGRGRDDVRPPLRFVLLVEVDGDFFAAGWGSGGRGGGAGFEGPGAFVEEDGGGVGALQ